MLKKLLSSVATDVIIMTGAFTGQDNEDNASVDCCILNFMMHIVCMITQCFFKSSRHLKRMIPFLLVLLLSQTERKGICYLPIIEKIFVPFEKDIFFYLK